MLGWCRWTDDHHMIFSGKSILLLRIAMVYARGIRSKPTEINKLESVDNPRVSGHLKRTSSGEDTVSQRGADFEKIRKSEVRVLALEV